MVGRASPRRAFKLDLRAYSSSIGVTLPSPIALIDHEEVVWERAIRPILQKLGYDDSDYTPKPSYIHSIVGERREVDWAVYQYDNIPQGERFLSLYGMLVDVKAHGVDLTNRLEEKLCGYCGLFDSKFGILANDTELIVIKPTRGVVDWEYLSSVPTKAELLAALKVRPTYSSSDKILAVRLASTADITEKVIQKIADDCNDIIRRRKEMWSKKRQFEFSKLLLLRIQDEREYIEGKKNKLDITSEEVKTLLARNINVTEHMNTLFQALVAKTGIFPKGEKLEINDGVIEETVQTLDVHALWLNKIEILGQVYERFLMDTMTGRELGEYFTPRSLVDLTVDMINPSHGQKVLDPACGTAGFLIYSLHHVLNQKNHVGSKKPAEYYGIEIDDDTHKLAKINSWLHNDSHENIIRADSLDPKQAPPFLLDGLRNPEKDGFENILTNPPFGSTGQNLYPPSLMNTYSENWKNIGVTLFESAASGKGVIPQCAFLELCTKALKQPKEPLKGGRLGTIIDFGIFSNIRNEEPLIRRILRRETIIEAIIGLPKGAFMMYGFNVIPCILILRKKHDSEVQGTIFRTDIQKIGYVYGTSRFRASSDEDIKKVLTFWYKWASSKGIVGNDNN